MVYLRIEICDEIVRVLSWKFDISLKSTTIAQHIVVSSLMPYYDLPYGLRDDCKHRQDYSMEAIAQTKRLPMMQSGQGYPFLPLVTLMTCSRDQVCTVKPSRSMCKTLAVLSGYKIRGTTLGSIVACLLQASRTVYWDFSTLQTTLMFSIHLR